MDENEIREEWMPPGPDDPPEDLSMEEGAYAREEERLVRDHLGKYALIYRDQEVGVFDTADEGIVDGYRRFGLARFVVKEIREPNEPPDFISLVDITHPSFERIEPESLKTHGQIPSKGG
jgi:hypothetical protein